MPASTARPARLGLRCLLFFVAMAIFCDNAPTLSAQTQATQSAPAAKSAPAEVKDDWEVMYSGTSRIGFGHTSRQKRKQGGQNVVIVDAEMTMHISRFGQSVKTRTITRTIETEAGALLEYQHEVQNPPAATTRVRGRVAGEKLIQESEVSGKVTTKELAWDKSVLAPGYQSQMLRDKPLKPGEKRTIKVFDPSLGAATTASYAAKDYEQVKLLNGKEARLLQVSLTVSLIPGMVMTEYVDAAGESLKTTMSLIQMTTYKCSRSEALKELTGGEVDLAVGTLIPVSPIPNPWETRRVVYRVSIAAEDPRKLLSECATQHIKSLDPQTAEVEVLALTPPPSKAGLPAAGKEFLEPNLFLQSDDEIVRKHAAAAAGQETDPWKVAQRIERWVYENLKRKNFSTLLASAGEVARTLEGDCTEHAVLLSAMARARGIPARVAIGLVYTKQPPSFGGHMWSEVYINGAWIPLDATLGKGHVAAERIKFTASSLAEATPGVIPEFLPMVATIGNMQIKVLKVE